jgi:hypothetical protein
MTNDQLHSSDILLQTIIATFTFTSVLASKFYFYFQFQFSISINFYFSFSFTLSIILLLLLLALLLRNAHISECHMFSLLILVYIYYETNVCEYEQEVQNRKYEKYIHYDGLPKQQSAMIIRIREK